MIFNGIQIRESLYAIEVRHEFRVEPWPARKRRRGWRVVKHTAERPCAYMIGDHTVVAHPSIVAKLKEKKNEDSSPLAQGCDL